MLFPGSTCTTQLFFVNMCILTECKKRGCSLGSRVGYYLQTSKINVYLWAEQQMVLLLSSSHHYICRSHNSEDTSHSSPTDQNSINVVREKRKRARQLMDSDSESDGKDQGDRSDAGRALIQSQPAAPGSLHHQLESPELTENTVDSESDGNDQVDRSDVGRDLMQSQPAAAGSLHHQLQSPELTENTVVNAHEQIAVATEGSMSELAFSQTASNHTDM